MQKVHGITFLSIVATSWLLSSCYTVPKAAQEQDAQIERTFTDAQSGHSFDSVIDFDDARVRDIDPSTLPAAPGACAAPVLVRVTEALDGDTLHVVPVKPASSFRLRMIGVNSPEISHMQGEVDQCYSREAQTFTHQLLGHLVWVTFDQGCEDQFERKLGYVYLGTRPEDFWQRQMLKRGYASAFTVAPNDAYERDFLADQGEAENAGRGLWSACR